MSALLERNTLRYSALRKLPFFIGGEITVSWISSSSGDKPKLMTYVTLGLAGQLA